MANQVSTNLKSLTMKMIASGNKTLPHLFVIGVALFLCVGTAAQEKSPGCSCDSSCSANNNCLLVSDYANRQVQQYDTAGCVCNATFLSAFTGAGKPGGEGLACVGSGSTGQLITANTGATLNVFNLMTGAYIPGSQLSVTGASFAALSVNALGTELYAADTSGFLDRFDLPLSLTNFISISSPYEHDIAVGYYGKVFATDFGSPGSAPGMEQYNSDLSGGTNYIPNSCWTFVNGDGLKHCTSALSGMTWDGTGNLWVGSTAVPRDENGVFEFAVGPTGQLLNGGVPLNFTADIGCDYNLTLCLPIGLTIAPPGVLDYAGNIVVANFLGQNVVRIDPATCTGNLNNGGLGMCTLFPFFTLSSQNNTPEPKYPIYTESCSIPSCYQPPNTTMVAWYPFDETSGTTSQNLASGNTGIWNPKNNPPVPVTGVVGGALSFNGTGQYVQSPDSIATNFGPATSSPCVSSGDYSSCPGDFSIDTWIMTSSDGVILDKRVSTPIGYAFYLQNGMLGLQLADGLGSVGYSNYFSPNVSTILYNGQWHHVVVTVQRTSPSVITWYLDGYCVGFPACTTSIPSDRLGSLVNASPLFIATNSTYIPPVGFLSGALDELEIYNRVLTPTEVLGIFNALSYGKCKP